MKKKLKRRNRTKIEDLPNEVSPIGSKGWAEKLWPTLPMLE